MRLHVLVSRYLSVLLLLGVVCNAPYLQAEPLKVTVVQPQPAKITRTLRV